MTQVAPLTCPEVTPPTVPATTPTAITTRFGEIALDPAKAITFTYGLLGFADRQRYVLVDTPPPQVAFKLLQSLDDPELAFLVLPLDPADGPIARADVEAACRVLALDPAPLALLGIVTLRREPPEVQFTVNLRAPLLLDTERRIGFQHVLPHENYSLREPLPRGDEDVA